MQIIMHLHKDADMYSATYIRAYVDIFNNDIYNNSNFLFFNLNLPYFSTKFIKLTSFSENKFSDREESSLIKYYCIRNNLTVF